MRSGHTRSALAQALIAGLANIPGVTVYGPPIRIVHRHGLLHRSRPPRLGDRLRLDEEHDVLCRVGLHCAPAAHRTLGTFPEGTVRFAPGVFTTLDDIRAAVHAVAQVFAS